MKSIRSCLYAFLLLIAIFIGRGVALRTQRQAGRYGGPNYRPGPGYNTAVRGSGGSSGANLGNGINSPFSGIGSLKSSSNTGTTRPLGVGAFSFGGGGGGGLGSGGGTRPAYGPSFALNSPGSIGHRPQQQQQQQLQPQQAAVVGGGGGRPQQGSIYRGAPALGRPSGPFQYN